MVWKATYHAEGGGEKHVRDIRRMIELSGDLIDRRSLRVELRTGWSGLSHSSVREEWTNHVKAYKHDRDCHQNNANNIW